MVLWNDTSSFHPHTSQRLRNSWQIVYAERKSYLLLEVLFGNRDSVQSRPRFQSLESDFGRSWFTLSIPAVGSLPVSMFPQYMQIEEASSIDGMQMEALWKGPVFAVENGMNVKSWRMMTQCKGKLWKGPYRPIIVGWNPFEIVL